MSACRQSARRCLIGRSFTLDADLDLAKGEASGVVLALASRLGGWSLWLDHGKPTFTWSRSTDPEEIVHIRAASALPAGATKLTMRFAVRGMGGPAEVILSNGGQEVARGMLPGSILMPAGGGETMDIGRDLGVPVTDYPTALGAIEGDVRHVGIAFD